MRHVGCVLLVFGASGCFQFSEEEVEPDGGDKESCATDEQCRERFEPGFQCLAGNCRDAREPIPPEARIEGDACGRSEDCFDCRRAEHCLACSSSADCNYSADYATDTFRDRDQVEQVCAIAGRSCEELQSCRSTLACAPPLGERPGGFSCTSDAECTAGLCVALGESSPDLPAFRAFERSGAEPGVCLRTCTADTECPYVSEGDGAVGLRCTPFVYGRRVIKGCLPADTNEPLCALDADCPVGAECRFETIEVTRRGKSRQVGVPLCGPPAGATPTGAPCSQRDSPVACTGGLCAAACVFDSSVDDANFLFCDGDAPGATDPTRCSQPCQRDGDCPRPLACVDAPEYAGAGGWIEPWDIPGEDFVGGRNVRFCTLPPNGCTDEFDCRGPGQHPGGASGWDPVAAPRCVVHVDPQLPPATCVAPDGTKSAPGAGCVAHADCESNLCAPRADDASTRICTSPCSPVLADRCGQLTDRLAPDFAGLADLRCEPLEYEGAPGLHACR